MNFSVITTQFWGLVLQGLALGLIYALVSLGYTMVYGVLRLINFANSEVFMIGTFATLYIEIHILGYATNSPSLHGAKLVWTLLLVFIDSQTGKIVAGPDIHARGFAEDLALFEEVKGRIERALAGAVAGGINGTHQLSQVVRKTVGSRLS